MKKVQWLSNIKVGYKLGILIVIALVALSVTSYIGYVALHKADEALITLYEERLVPTELLHDTRSKMRYSNGALLELMVTTDEKRNQELKALIEQRNKQIGENMEMLEKIRMDETSRGLIGNIKSTRDKYNQARTEVLELALQNKNAEAYAVYGQKLDKLADQYAADLQKLADYYDGLSKQSQKDNLSMVQAVNQLAIGVFSAAFILLIFLGMTIGKSITQPLVAMVAFCQEMAAGDFRDKPRTCIRKDEFGQLADNMADMRNQLRALMKQISSSAEQLAAASEQLTASAEQSAQASNQVAVSITEVASGSQQQLGVAQSATLVVEEISDNIEQISHTVRGVATQSTETADKAKEGSLAVEDAISQMNHIEESVNFSAGVIRVLGEQSKEIGQIVDTIAGIAAQTNLLALNAAIEAARAGEQGRGFAVVAEEVRKLAEQSHDASKQIAQMIGQIQVDTAKAVQAMNEGTKEVQVGAASVNTTGKIFREIVQQVQRVSAQGKEMADAVQEMTAGSKKIVDAVKNIEHLNAKSAEESQTVSAATEEQSASMEEIASSSQALAKLAQEMQESVKRFQV